MPAAISKLIPPSMGISQGGGQQGAPPGPTGGPGGCALISSANKKKIAEKIRIENIFFSMIICDFSSELLMDAALLKYV